MSEYEAGQLDWPNFLRLIPESSIDTPHLALTAMKSILNPRECPTGCINLKLLESFQLETEFRTEEFHRL